MNLLRLGRGQDSPFPHTGNALNEPNGLLAWGGDLSVPRLRTAYRHGIFPWYSEGQPILWWSPDPRAGFNPCAMHIPRRLARWLRNCQWTMSSDTCFDDVVEACAAPRDDDGGTWITAEMRSAYAALHRAGDAHSIEVFAGDRLVGGLYGVASGSVFCAESMFSGEDHASKVAVLGLADHWQRAGGAWIDAQIPSAHLATLGAITVARGDYLDLLAIPALPVMWTPMHFRARDLINKLVNPA